MKLRKRADFGLFITIEGGEGSGKTTLIERLYEFLTNEKSRVVVRSFEPGGTPFGQKLRKLLLEEKDALIAPRAELFLFLSDRAHHVQTLIKPSLEQDMVVLCDRFTDSSLAYQGAARDDEDLKELARTCLFAAGNMVPDITFYLDLDPKEGLARIKGDKDRLESEALSFHEKVREGYLNLAKKDSGRIKVLDATKSQDEVFSEAVEHLTELLKATDATI